jgi:hypothetical protein
VPAEFRIENWHADSEQVRPYLEQLIKEKSHAVVPLNAYDQYGDIIKPRQYESHLRGAVARFYFSLKHWDIKEQSTFVADIEQIRVLVPPPSTPSRRRKLSLKDALTPELSPSKRQRTMMEYMRRTE